MNVICISEPDEFGPGYYLIRKSDGGTWGALITSDPNLALAVEEIPAPGTDGRVGDHFNRPASGPSITTIRRAQVSAW